MEDIIKKKCEDVGISPDILTQEELAQLRLEIQAERRGKQILDGVLQNPELYYRGLKR